MIVEIIPILPVNEPCQWCEPQKCYTASVWWGSVLLDFYTLDPKRLEPEALNREACEILRKVTSAIDPDSKEIIDPEKLDKALGWRSCGRLACYWSDFAPAVLMCSPSKCCIPTPEAP
jgi:hypothetical protein